MRVTGWTPPWRSRHKRWWLLLLSVWLSWLILSALLLPWWLNNRLPLLLREQQGLLLHTESTRFNPFTLAVTARGLDLRLSGGEPLLALRELRINLSLLSAFRAAIGFDEIALVEPTLTLMLYADGSSNWQRIGTGANAAPNNSDHATTAEPNADNSNTELPRLLLHHFELSGGAIALQDFRLHEAGRHSGIAGLGITLDDVSTLPDDQGFYRVQGQLPGDGNFAWRGQVSLNPFASQGELQLTDVALTPLAPLLLPEPGELRGRLNADARYQFARSGNAFRFQLLDANSTLQDFHWQLPGEQAPRLDWPLLAVDGVVLDTDSQLISIRRVALESAQLQLARDEAGAIRGAAATTETETAPPEPTQPQPALPTPTSPSPPEPAAATWAIKLVAIDISALSLSLIDDSRQLPLQASITDLNLQTAATLDLTSAGVVLEQLQLDIAALHVAERADDAAEPSAIARLQTVSLAAARVDTATRAFAAEQVSLGAGELRLRRQASGAIWPLAYLAERQPSADVAPPWHYDLASILLQQVAISVTDETLQPAATLTLQLDRLTLAPLSNRGQQSSQLNLNGQLPPGGALSFAGSVAADQSAVSGQLALTNLPLALAEPYLQATLAADIAGGSLSSRGELQATGLNNAPRVRYRGDASIDQFLLKATATPLLGWQQLQATRLTLDSAPLALSIDQLRWTKPVATLHFAADGSSNFSALTVAPAAAAADGSAVAGSATTDPTISNSTTNNATTDASASIRIKRIDLLDGALDFADARLVLPYRADIRQFNGSVTGLSSAPASRATVALEGQVDAYGRAQLDGELQPLAPTAWLDLMLRFRNVALVPFTPYSATFAGRKITDGTLTMDLRYRVQDGKLQGENRVVLDQFSLGERVESPDAMSLPLDLALAILRDSNGRIDLDMPVEGDVNDPQFRYGKVIWQAVVNVLTKIVTSPFRALASLFGDDSAVVEAIVFEPGRRQLTPPELEKLDRLAAVVKQRPDLRLNISGPFDPVQDAAALKVDQLRRQLATRLGLTVAADSAPAAIALTDPDNQKALEDLYDERFGAAARAAKLAAENQSRKTPYQTVNRMLATFGGGAGDAAWYGLLQAELENAQLLPADLLLQLAEARADQVVARLSALLPATQWQREPAQAVGESQNNAVALGLALAPVSAAVAAPIPIAPTTKPESVP